MGLVKDHCKDPAMFEEFCAVLVRYRDGLLSISHVIMAVCAMFAGNEAVISEFRKYVPPGRVQELDIELLSCRNAQLIGKEAALAPMPTAELARLQGTLEAALARVRAVQEERARRLAAVMCIRCRSAPRSVALLPCRHMCLCGPCSDELQIPGVAFGGGGMTVVQGATLPCGDNVKGSPGAPQGSPGAPGAPFGLHGGAGVGPGDAMCGGSDGSGSGAGTTCPMCEVPVTGRLTLR